MAGVLLFAAGAAVSLAASWLLVSRLERLGERAGFSEAWLGLVAALAADAPEITSAVTALARGQASVGAGVVIGSNVFNLAALLGLAAVVAGRIAFHRRVVLLAGVPAVWVAAATVLTVTVLAPAAGLVLTVAMLGPYVAVLGMRRVQMENLGLPSRWTRWLVAAVHEEEDELAEAVKPRRGTGRDAIAAAGALLAVVGASAGMEVAATAAGHRYGVADIVTGGLVLAVVTSLPNAVAAVYLARRGRGAAVLSIALNSNAINIVAGLLIPACVAGLGPPSGQGTLIAGWYAGMTVLALALAYRVRGLGRAAGAVIIASYLVFVAALLIAVKLLPGNDQAVLLAKAFQVPAGYVLHPVERLGVLGVGPHDQGAGLDGERRAAAEPPAEHRARGFLDDLYLVAEVAGELLAVALAAFRRDPRRGGDTHRSRLGRF
jgi:cation:H+ antiporter